MTQQQRVLHLTLKKKWYDMWASGIKTEDYRLIKPYWISRLKDKSLSDPKAFKEFDVIQFRNGYGKNAPTMTFEFKGIDIGEAVPAWSDNWEGDVFRIKGGKRLS